jgi:hypothetical protein
VQALLTPQSVRLDVRVLDKASGRTGIVLQDPNENRKCKIKYDDDG